ncbi:Stealth CR1 domain-containing protein [Gracilimonas sp. Q87]|uniref:Stealth CR1 domain-containing protein n=1 Tax=Gracilimonas sp. Q87 TaxID=3384766 RepID=UPI0039845C25
MISKDENIDAVITWVDGEDPVHRKKRLSALKDSDNGEINTLPSGADTTRFSDNDEIRYCIKSIIKFASWIRNIYIITDDQRPDFLTDEYMERNNIYIVDHKEIFTGYEWALPTFNTRTIVTAMWRIPGLAPRFINFDDDFVLTRKVEVEDFFVDGKTVLQGSWHKIKKYGPLRLKWNKFLGRLTKKLFGITRSMHTLLQVKSAQVAGFSDQYFYVPHVPHPIQKDTLASFFEENPEIFENNIKYPFRSTDQFSAIILANHLDIKYDKAILRKKSEYLMVHGEMDPSFLLDLKLKKIRDNKVKFICIQSMEGFKPDQRTKVYKTLDKILG